MMMMGEGGKSHMSLFWFMKIHVIQRKLREVTQCVFIRKVIFVPVKGFFGIWTLHGYKFDDFF